MKCKICKHNIEDLNLSIFHDCNNDLPYIFDINKEEKYYCLNPFKNIHMYRFYNQIEFQTKKDNFISEFEFKGIFIIESLLLNFFNYQFNNQIDKLLFHNSSFSEEIAEKLKRIIQNLHNFDLEEKIEKIIKDFILDVYYLILASGYFNFFETKLFPKIFTKKTENYKKEIINYFQQYLNEKEKIADNFKKYIYIPNNAKVIYNLEKNNLLMKYNYTKMNINYNKILLYSIEKNKILSSCDAGEVIKMNNNNYIGIDNNKSLINIEIKIDEDKNTSNLEVSQCFKYEDIKIIDFNIIDDYRLICIDSSNNIHLLLRKNNDYFIYRSINPKILKYNNEQILIDKDNEQFLILYITDKNGTLEFYDFELNLKNNIQLKDLYNSLNRIESNSKKKYFPAIIKFNNDLYIIFGKRIYLISAKYLEVISILNNIQYRINCELFVFSNSEEFFIKSDNDDIYCYFYHYKLVKNQLVLIKKYFFEEELIELKEIDNKGNYSLLYKDFNFLQKYYIKNNKNENYSYPLFKEIRTKSNSRKSKGIANDGRERDKHTWDEKTKNKFKYYEKYDDNYYFERALNPVKKREIPERPPNKQKNEDKKEGKEEGENGEEKKEVEEESIKGNENKEYRPREVKEEEKLNEKNHCISLKGYLKEKEEGKEIKKIQNGQSLTKIEKKEENILATSVIGRKKEKKKKLKEVKKEELELNSKMKFYFKESERNHRIRQRGRGRGRLGLRKFVYNEEDFPKFI